MVKAPKGTQDVFGESMQVSQHIEAKIRQLTHLHGFLEIRTPIIEHTDLFLRGVGDTTDIVEKQMYTFLDKAGRSLSLRPELTAGVGRAYIEHGMSSRPQPIKLWYLGQNFRYEKPQAGRYRQHTQFGTEIFGAAGPGADAEVIALAYAITSALCPNATVVKLNSIGCATCRIQYNDRLLEYLQTHQACLCGLCAGRMHKNPLRTLDCKENNCRIALAMAPLPLDGICDECRAHFDGLKQILQARDVAFEIDKKIVRGLDYYTRTVFEFVCDGQAVLGGGRYDGLIQMLGGPNTPGVGFGMGIERLGALVRKHMPQPDCAPAIFLASATPSGSLLASRLCGKLREAGIAAQTDLCDRSLKAQMKYADKIGAKYSMVLGDDEAESGMVSVKNMGDGTAHSLMTDDVVGFLLNTGK